MALTTGIPYNQVLPCGSKMLFATFKFYLLVRECSSLRSSSTRSFEIALESLQKYGLRQSGIQSLHTGVGGEGGSEASEPAPGTKPEWKFTPSTAWEKFTVEENLLDPDEAAKQLRAERR